MTVSLWRRTTALGVITCDTAVIGAGITGVSAALALQRRGVDALIIERHTLGSGASTRNAGYLMRGAADNYAAAMRDWGRATAKRLWKLTEENITALRQEGVDRLPSYRAIPSCLLALSEEELTELRNAFAELSADGFEAAWLSNASDVAWSKGQAKGGLVNPHDAVINPVELLTMLASRLTRPILDRQEVFEIVPSPTDDRVHLRITDAEVQCKRVLVCTNAYTSALFPALNRLVVPNRGQMLALDARDARLDYSYYANHGGEYFRQASPGVIALGGWRKHFAAAERTTDDRTTDDVQRGLEAFAHALFGKRYPVLARWAGTMAFTPDGLPIVDMIPLTPTPTFAMASTTSTTSTSGQSADVDNTDPRVWFCGGYTGHGMSLGYRLAHHAVSAMLGEETPWFRYSRFPSPLPNGHP